MGTTRWAILILAAGSFVCFSASAQSPAAKQADVRKQVLDIVEAMEPQYLQRAQLLKRSAGSCRMELSCDITKDEISKMTSRAEKELGVDGSKLVFKGQNTAEIAWKQRDENLRYDVHISKNSNYEARQRFIPENKRIAVNEEQGIYYDVQENVAYINRPPIKAVTPTSLKERFEVGKLYLFHERDIPWRLKDASEKGQTPVFSEISVEGVPCIKLAYAREDRQSSDGKEYLWERYCYFILSPEQAYSLIEASEGVKYYVDGNYHCGAEYKYEAEYHESTEQPGIWLLSRVSESMSDEAKGMKDSIKVEFNETKVGIEVPDREFTFEGLGVPEGTLVNDKRLDGVTMRMKYTGGVVVPELPKSLNSEIPATTTEPQKEATTKAVRTLPSPDSSKGQGPVDKAEAGRSIWPLVCGAAATLTVVIVFVLQRRRRRR